MKAGTITVLRPPGDGTVEAPQDRTPEEAPPETDDETTGTLDPEFLAWLEELL